MRAPEPKKALKECDAVFSGKVIEIKEPSNIFVILQRWKGVSKKKKVVVSTGPGNCSYTFKIDQDYLIYANG